MKLAPSSPLARAMIQATMTHVHRAAGGGHRADLDPREALVAGGTADAAQRLAALGDDEATGGEEEARRDDPAASASPPIAAAISIATPSPADQTGSHQRLRHGGLVFVFVFPLPSSQSKHLFHGSREVTGELDREGQGRRVALLLDRVDRLRETPTASARSCWESPASVRSVRTSFCIVVSS